MTNALKTSALVLATVIGFGAAAAPALASVANADGFDPAYYLTQLKYDGVNASAVDEVTNSVIRATIVVDGRTSFQFFDRDSLQPLKH